MSRSLLFITPTYPSFHGNGLAMRAAATLKLLADCGAKVHLLIIPLYKGGNDRIDSDIAEMCDSRRTIENPAPAAAPVALQEWYAALGGLKVIPREWSLCNSQWQALVESYVREYAAEAIVLFRFYLAPFVAGVKTPLWLDVDELESTARSRLSHLYSQTGKLPEAFQLRMEALSYEKLECRYLPRFERIFAASPIEARAVSSRDPDADVHVLPNCYPTIRSQAHTQPNDLFRFLFVGTLSYYPNIDAVRYFCREILPLIQEKSRLRVQLDVVGYGLPEQFDCPPGAHIIGEVPDTAQHYAACHAVVVPLRAAGGTRIKILEAFSYRRAVVSTKIGAEGLEVMNDTHLLLADEPEKFAQACLRLIDDTETRQRIADSGHSLFLEHYTLDKLHEKSPMIFGDRSVSK